MCGEAGIGKTALLEHFRAELAPRFTVVWGTCDPLFAPQPLGALLEPAAELGGALRRARGGEARPYEVAAALAGALRERVPSVLVLEDLHWGDEATLDVVRLLPRQLESAATLVVLCFRDDCLHRTHPLARLLGEMAPGAVSARLELTPLSCPAVREMALGTPLDPDVLHARTDGNPFYVTEALAAGSTQVPATVRDAVLARIGRLGKTARDLLDAVAVIPQRAEVWLLEAMCDGELDALDECLRSGVLRAEADGVLFRHEIARLAVEETLAPHRAVALHRRALTALGANELGAVQLARLAHHAEAAGHAAAVLRYAPAAGEQAAALGAPREAERQYMRALRFARHLPPTERAPLQERFAAHAYLGDQRIEAAIEGCRRGDRHLWRGGDVLRQGTALLGRSRLLGCIGHLQEASADTAEALELLRRTGSSVSFARALSCRAGMLTNEDLAAAAALAERACAVAEEVGDVEALVHALNNIGSVELAGNTAGQAKLERSLELARQWQLGTDAGRAYMNLDEALRHCGQWNAALSWIERGIEYTQKLGLEASLKCLIGARAVVELALGRWDEAAATAETILDGPREQILGPRSDALVTLALVRARRGDPGSWPLLDEARETAIASDDLQWLAPVAAARAEAAWLEGRTDAIGAETEHAYDMACRLGEPTFAGSLACSARGPGSRSSRPTGYPSASGSSSRRAGPGRRTVPSPRRNLRRRHRHRPIYTWRAATRCARSAPRARRKARRRDRQPAAARARRACGPTSPEWTRPERRRADQP